jgi:putative sigma-54 modulation protein
MMKFQIRTRNYEADAKITDYIEDKLGGLEKYLPRHARASAMVEVVLEDDTSGREDNRFVCEAIVIADGDQMISREGTVNMYAAVDIVEAKLKSQITAYKEKRITEPRRARMASRLIGRKSETDPSTPEHEIIP